VNWSRPSGGPPQLEPRSELQLWPTAGRRRWLLRRRGSRPRAEGFKAFSSRWWRLVPFGASTTGGAVAVVLRGERALVRLAGRRPRTEVGAVNKERTGWGGRRLAGPDLGTPVGLPGLGLDGRLAEPRVGCRNWFLGLEVTGLEAGRRLTGPIPAPRPGAASRGGPRAGGPAPRAGGWGGWLLRGGFCWP